MTEVGFDYVRFEFNSSHTTQSRFQAEILKFPSLRKMNKIHIKMRQPRQLEKKNILCSLVSIHFFKLMSSMKIFWGESKWGVFYLGNWCCRSVALIICHRNLHTRFFALVQLIQLVRLPILACLSRHKTGVVARLTSLVPFVSWMLSITKAALACGSIRQTKSGNIVLKDLIFHLGILLEMSWSW